MRRPQCNVFYHISAYKSMYGQDRTITLIHMLSSNKSSVLIYTFPFCYGIKLWSMHYTEDKGRDIKNHYTGHCSSDISPKLSLHRTACESKIV